MQADDDLAERHRIWSVIERVLRPAGAALVAGLVAGAVAAGGSRVAMRIAALAADPCAGIITENDNPCGVFTLGGTFGLIFFGAVFTGVPARGSRAQRVQPSGWRTRFRSSWWLPEPR